ncbi:helix-turn-helix domain-containing protein [Stenotrophomonas muris]|uniref:helix-turn-helix domain-containing protein n=1 Tax=Stenotrophomonas muris TaxID=2963283 RepID=UPI00066DDC0A
MADAGIADGTATRILQLLQEGPGLAGELAAELQLPSNRVSSYLHQLAKTGRVRRAPFHGPDERPSVLWSLQAVSHE